MAAIPPPQVTRHNQLRSACLAARRLPVTWPTPLLSASRHRDGGRRELLGRSTLTGSGSGKAKTVDPVVFQVTSGPASSTLGSVIRLAEPARLVWPTQEVRVSYLVGEQADCLLRGTPTQWLEAAGEDFADNVRTERDRAPYPGYLSTRIRSASGWPACRQCMSAAFRNVLTCRA